jgi:hypothetical protein
MVAVGNEVSAAPALDLVQIGLLPSTNLPFQYSLTAYNTSGYQVASYESKYPAAAFQLPTGTYLVTASAYYQNSTYCYVCLQGAGVGVKQQGAPAGLYRPYFAPYTEYGYALTQVTGPTGTTIKMQNVSAVPLTSLTIRVGYANGTAAVGASVSGYVVGSYYAYSPQMVTYGQTGKSGTVTLVMPQAPVDINAYLSIPIKLPKNSSVVTVVVGGQKVNVTVYLQPSYLSLHGQALLLPPQTGANVILQYQPYDQYVIPYAGAQTGAGGGVYSTSATTAQAPGPAGQTSTQSPAVTKIAPFNPTGSQITTVSSPSTTASAIAAAGSATTVEVAAGVGLLAAVVVLAALLARKSGSRVTPA